MKGKLILIIIVSCMFLMPLVQSAKASGDFSALYSGETTYLNIGIFFGSTTLFLMGQCLFLLIMEQPLTHKMLQLLCLLFSCLHSFDMSLLEVSYNASWENKTVTIFQNDIDRTNITKHNFGPVAFGGLINFTNVPRGENNIEFKVKKGAIIIDKENIPQTYQFASITKTEMLRFTVNNAYCK